MEASAFATKVGIDKYTDVARRESRKRGVPGWCPDGVEGWRSTEVKGKAEVSGCEVDGTKDGKI
jgi:hypothetical protein